MTLTQEQKVQLIACIQEGKPIPKELHEILLTPIAGGEFIWSGKCRSIENFCLEEKLSIELSMPWKNTLFIGDNKLALATLLQKKNYTILEQHGGVKFIYIDPPYAVGTEFHMAQDKSEKKEKKKKILAYSDKWDSVESYYSMIYPRLVTMYELLAEDGCICLHCDWRVVSALRLMLDEIFGADHFLNDIIWHYTGGGRANKYFSRKHDNLLLYAKGASWTFNIDAVRVPYKKTSGYAKKGIVSQSGKYYTPHPKGTPIDDVWDIPIINPMSSERVGYATQKPAKLLERIISAMTNPKDIVADFFCGSGTTIDVAQSLKRRWIACDQSDTAILTVQERLKLLAKGQSNDDITYVTHTL